MGCQHQKKFAGMIDTVGNGLDRSAGFGLLVFCLVISFGTVKTVPYNPPLMPGCGLCLGITPNSSLLTPNFLPTS